MRQHYLVLVNERYSDSIKLLQRALGYSDNTDKMLATHINSADQHLHGSEYMLSYSTIKLLQSVYVNELAEYHFAVSQFEEELLFYGL